MHPNGPQTHNTILSSSLVLVLQKCTTTIFTLSYAVTFLPIFFFLTVLHPLLLTFLDVPKLLQITYILFSILSMATTQYASTALSACC